MKRSKEYPRNVYYHLYSRNVGAFDKIYKQLPFESIELERTANLGISPVYKIILFRNGTVEYEGLKNIDPIGKFKGLSTVSEFGKLSYLIEELDIENFKEEYRHPATCKQSTYLRINRADGTTKQIKDYGNIAPIKLWAVQHVIDSYLNSIKWEKV